MNSVNREPFPEETPPAGSGLFMRSVFCAFVLLALFSLFALHTDFSERAKSAFKAAVTENSENFIPQVLESARGKIFKNEEDSSPNDGQDYLPDSENTHLQESYPNPILMPSETMTENGFIPSSDL